MTVPRSEPRPTILAEGSPQALEPVVVALRAHGIPARLVPPPGGCGSG